MANVEDVKLPYEILIRFGDKGLPKGAHAQYIRRISIDGEVIKEEIGNAEPLDLEGFPTSGLMADTARDALAEVTRLNAMVADLNAECNTLKNDLTVAVKRGDDLDMALSEANARVTSVNEEMKSRISELENAAETQHNMAQSKITELETALTEANEHIKVLELTPKQEPE